VDAHIFIFIVIVVDVAHQLGGNLVLDGCHELKFAKLKFADSYIDEEKASGGRFLWSDEIKNELFTPQLLSIWLVTSCSGMASMSRFLHYNLKPIRQMKL